jgi:hypothetical protein
MEGHYIFINPLFIVKFKTILFKIIPQFKMEEHYIFIILFLVV